MESTSDPLFSVALSKKKLNTLLFGCIAFLAAGYWFISSPATFSKVPFMNERFTVAIGTAAIVFAGFMIFFYFKKIKDTAPGLVIDERGIFDNTSAVSAGLIPWEDITGTRAYEVAGRPFLMVYVKNPESYISRQSGLLKRKIMQMNFNSYGTPVNIIAQSLQCTFGELTDAVEAGCKKYITTV